MSNDPSEPSWNYVGPNCDFTQYFTSSPTSIDTCFNNNRYLKIVAYFISSDDSTTSTLDSVTIDYTVAAANPYIVLTDPINTANPVPQTQQIFIRFSEIMDTTSLIYNVNPATSTTETWSENNSAVTINHAAPLQECKVYTVTITQAKDAAGNNLVPNPVDTSVTNPFTFVTECVHPWITATNPASSATDVPLAAQIVVDFSEAMDTTSLGVGIAPNLSLTSAWSNGDTRVTLSHVVGFTQCSVYTVNITATDLAGLALVPGPAPNPWSFQAHCTTPYIVTTNPAQLQYNIALNAQVVVVFSEPMVQASVQWSIVPNVVFTTGWTNGDRTLTLSHAAPLAGCTPYVMNITAGNDVDEGLPLYPGQAPGGAPHPWKFETVCANPFLVITIPADGETNVNESANIQIAFSEAMNIGAVTVSIVPSIPMVPQWSAGNQLLTLLHASPFACGQNTVTVSGLDSDEGLPLVPGLAANPFSFTPLCPNPFILSTDPADGATNVPLAADVIVTFSEAMNTTSVVAISNPRVNFTATWSAGDTVMTLSHAIAFAQSTTYQVDVVAGTDTDGNGLVNGPAVNPWSFTTVGLDPQILTTDPVNGATSVPLAANVIVTFSKPMDTTTVTANPVPFVLFNYAWNPGPVPEQNTVLTLSHITAFTQCAVYSITVQGSDMGGRSLVAGPVPNPWSFTTVCFAPRILDTNPADGATGVAIDAPIWVNFTKPMNTGFTNGVSTPFVAFTSAWSNGDTTLRLSHASPFAECTTYSINVTGKDTTGADLAPGSVPNPWSFDTSCPSPYIVSTNPANGATGVPLAFSITVTFSQSMDTNTFTWSMLPPPLGTPTLTWLAGNTIITISFSQPQMDCTTYTVTIGGSGTNGRPLVAGPVPNPWSFSTVCTITPPGGLTIRRVAPTTINLTWNAAAGATSYRVYESQNRFANFPGAWNVLGNPVATGWDAAGHLTDGLTHYYIVRSMRSTTLSSNSTMAVKIQMNVGFTAAGPNVRWFSLPYRSTLLTASAIVQDIEGPSMGHTKIDVVARWDPATQNSQVFAWFRGAWRGTDFTVGAGDSMWMNSVSAFSWVVVGTDRAPTLTFTVHAPPLGNVNWRGIPYTGTYTRASDLVRDIAGGTGPGTNTKIIEVVKWDATTQTFQRYSYGGSGWSGNDFTINPGDGIYFNIVASFTWQPKLVTPEVP